MMLIRPVAMSDLNSLCELAQKTGPGLTTLPNDKELLEDKIEQSLLAFSSDVTSPGLEYYLFILEDTENGVIVGTSALAATVGLSEAFYSYHLGMVVHNSHELNVHNVISILSLCNDYTGTTEICTLFLHPDYRKEGNGQLLSRCRFLFMAMHQQRFAAKVIAELRGVSDAEGNSPFWDAIGSHFFSMKFIDADAISGHGNNQFIAELMPKYPIYLPMLPQSALDVIGQVHPDTLPALKMLEKEGFEYCDYVDIFDAGPSIEVKTSKINSIQNSNNCTVVVVEDAAFRAIESQLCMLSNEHTVNFRACYGNGILKRSQITISATLANNLKVTSDDILRVYPTERKSVVKQIIPQEKH